MLQTAIDNDQPIIPVVTKDELKQLEQQWKDSPEGEERNAARSAYYAAKAIHEAQQQDVAENPVQAAPTPMVVQQATTETPQKAKLKKIKPDDRMYFYQMNVNLCGDGRMKLMSDRQRGWWLFLTLEAWRNQGYLFTQDKSELAVLAGAPHGFDVEEFGKEIERVLEYWEFQPVDGRLFSESLAAQYHGKVEKGNNKNESQTKATVAAAQKKADEKAELAQLRKLLIEKVANLPIA